MLRIELNNLIQDMFHTERGAQVSSVPMGAANSCTLVPSLASDRFRQNTIGSTCNFQQNSRSLQKVLKSLRTYVLRRLFQKNDSWTWKHVQCPQCSQNLGFGALLGFGDQGVGHLVVPFLLFLARALLLEGFHLLLEGCECLHHFHHHRLGAGLGL